MGGDTAGAAEMFGLFATVWGLMQFPFSPLLGALSDRYGRRPVILISSLGLGLDYIFCSALVQGLVVGPAVKRLGTRWALIGGLLFGCLGAYRRVVPAGCAGDGAMGRGRPQPARHDEPARQPVRTGPAAGRQQF